MVPLSGENDRWLSLLRGPLATATLAILLEVISQAGISVPHVDGFLVLIVAYVAFVDGIAAGVMSAAIGVLYYAYASSPEGEVFHLAVFQWEPILIVGATLPVLAFIIGYLRTELQKTQAREQVVRRELDTVLESLSAGFYTVDGEGRITYVNPAAAQILSQSPESLVGRGVHDVEPMPPGAEAGGGLALALDGGTSGTYEVESPQLGSWFDVHAHPMADGAAVYFADVTERRRMRDRAYGAAKMEALGRLAGGIAHDFNNLLTAIRGFNDLVLHQLDPDDTRREGLEQVAKAAERASRLTHQILAYTKRQVLQPQVLDLNRQVVDMEPMLRRLVRADVRLETDLDAELFPIRVDAGQLEQILLNLAINASDAMPDGGRLAIRTSRAFLDRPFPHGRFVIEPGDYAVISVEDTGVGMDAETMERIFEPFFSTKSRTDGTGLGLATVYGIVKQSGGYILVDSAPNEGSRFHVWLPRTEGVVAAVREEAPPQESRRSNGARVLVVEDDDAVRELTTMVLRYRGFDVLEARDGLHALELARRVNGPIDLLFTDIVMPGMSGRELARRLSSSRSEIKVLYTSGYTTENVIQNGIARGVLESDISFLHKPFTPDELVTRVDQMLGEKVAC